MYQVSMTQVRASTFLVGYCGLNTQGKVTRVNLDALHLGPLLHIVAGNAEAVWTLELALLCEAHTLRNELVNPCVLPYGMGASAQQGPKGTVETQTKAEKYRQDVDEHGASVVDECDIVVRVEGSVCR